MLLLFFGAGTVKDAGHAPPDGSTVHQLSIPGPHLRVGSK